MCEFCEEYLQEKKNAKEKKEKQDIDTTIKVEMRVIFTKYRVSRGSHSNGAKKLVYCPTCGKKLSELK